MAPKPPPKPPPPKNFFERVDNYLDSDQGKKRTAKLVILFFILAVVMYWKYKSELNKGKELIMAVASIREFAVAYDPSLEGKTDMEVLAAVHHYTLHLLNWTIKNEQLQNELNILIELLPGWQAFENNLYFFSDVRKTWQAARDDCLGRHTADLVSCRYGEEQGFIDMEAAKNKRGYWVGLQKNRSAYNGLLWLAGFHAGTLYWAKGQPDGKADQGCIVTVPDCPLKACWHDLACEEQRFFCCKMKPKDIWFY